LTVQTVKKIKGMIGDMIEKLEQEAVEAALVGGDFRQ
jgi:hypothetical protein